MIINIPKWLEYAYIESFYKNKIYIIDCKNQDFSYDMISLFQDEYEYIIIKNPINIMDSIEDKIIILYTNDINNNYDKDLLEKIIYSLSERFYFTVTKEVLQYIKKKEKCPFLLILKLSNGWSLDDEQRFDKENISNIPNTTIGTSKYMETSLWYFFLNEKENTFFGSYNQEKIFKLMNNFIFLEKNYGFIDENLHNIFFLPIEILKNKN